jgi:hypothetical protein
MFRLKGPISIELNDGLGIEPRMDASIGDRVSSP